MFCSRVAGDLAWIEHWTVDGASAKLDILDQSMLRKRGPLRMAVECGCRMTQMAYRQAWQFAMYAVILLS